MRQEQHQHNHNHHPRQPLTTIKITIIIIIIIKMQPGRVNNMHMWHTATHSLLTPPGASRAASAQSQPPRKSASHNHQNHHHHQDATMPGKEHAHVANSTCHLGWRTLLKCNKTNHAWQTATHVLLRPPDASRAASAQSQPPPTSASHNQDAAIGIREETTYALFVRPRQFSSEESVN
jgi:hypothetical protein